MDSVRKIKRLAWIWGILMALDVITTWLLMTQYGASEAVPTSKWLIERGWIVFTGVKMALVAVTGVLLTWAVKLKPSTYKLSKTALVAVCAFYVTPFIWNMYGIMIMNGWVEVPAWM